MSELTVEETSIDKNLSSEHTPAIELLLTYICKLIIGFVDPLGSQI